MKHWIIISSLILSITSCTKIDVDEDLPGWQTLQPHKMETALDRVNINADPSRIEDMMRRYNQDILVPADVEYYDGHGQLLFSKERKHGNQRSRFCSCRDEAVGNHI